MQNPLQYFWIFIFSVGTHAITLAAGCIVTVVIGLLEKHVWKRSVSWKAEVAILLAFVFFACFQAWRDEYVKSLGLQSALTQRPMPPIQVNIPPFPPAQVIIERETNIRQADLTGFQQLEKIEPIVGMNVLAPSRQIAFNVWFQSRGSHPIHDNHTGQRVEVLDMRIPGIEKDTRAKFMKFKKDRLEKSLLERSVGADVGVDVSTFVTAESAPLTEVQAQEALKGNFRIYLLFYSTWKDSLGQKGSLDACYWVDRVPTAELSIQTLVWQTCQVPY